MLKRKAKTAAGKRAMQKREPIAEEGAKTAIFMKGTNTSQVITDALKDLYSIKKPDAVLFSKRNEVRPFEDSKPLEFFSQKNDAALIVHASHSKKRPNNLVFARMFEHELLDMFEVGVENHVPVSSKANIMLGHRPLIIFNGNSWEDSPDLLTMRSILLDMFTGDPSADKLDLKGLSYLICFTLQEQDGKTKVLMRVYNILLKKSGGRKPRVELEEVGPSMDFIKGRCTNANMDMLKLALKEPMVNRVIILIRKERRRMLLGMN